METIKTAYLKEKLSIVIVNLGVSKTSTFFKN